MILDMSLHLQMEMVLYFSSGSLLRGAIWKCVGTCLVIARIYFQGRKTGILSHLAIQVSSTYRGTIDPKISVGPSLKSTVRLCEDLSTHSRSVRCRSGELASGCDMIHMPVVWSDAQSVWLVSSGHYPVGVRTTGSELTRELLTFTD